MMNNFAVFILSHGRANNLYTMKTLKICGYTGKVYILLDNEDEQIEQYKKLYGEETVIIFDKEKALKKWNAMNNFYKKHIVLWARNECQEIARNMGLEYIFMLDDDYTSFQWRYFKDGKLKEKNISNLDKICELYIDFMNKDKRIKSVCFAQGGDFIGGKENKQIKKVKRKAMNAFFIDLKNPIEFIGEINEDCNTYVDGGNKGDIYFTIPNIMLTQVQTQKNANGLTTEYLEIGTYTKSFYTIILQPSSVKIRLMGGNHKRLHHKIEDRYTYPRILREFI